MKKIFGKCVAAYLIASLTFTFGFPVYADWDDEEDVWDGFDASAPAPPPSAPSYTPPPAYTPPPSYEPSPAYTPPPSYSSPPASSFDEFDEPASPAWSEPPPPPPPAPAAPPPALGGAPFDDDEFSFSNRRDVDASSEGFIRVIRHPIQGQSDAQDAVIEGLQVSTEQGATEDEVAVTCYFIFRDRPTSFFYDVNRKDKKLAFEFMDARIGSSPIAALEQAPLQEIVIEAMQSDANRDIKGLEPEWHNSIRITFNLEHIPVISVSNEQTIISFSYKWTTNAERIPEYIEKDRFPLLFWASGGTIAGVGLGVLTYFLTKKEKVISNVLTTDDLPGGFNRSR